uniref:Uncharacterized protein n=1 Tax=Setaria italica TaxID=4555 RepID=K4AJR5_SETIT
FLVRDVSQALSRQPQPTAPAQVEAGASSLVDLDRRSSTASPDRIGLTSKHLCPLAVSTHNEEGVVKDKRTIWRLSIISDFFRAVVNFIRVFFLTMFS